MALLLGLTLTACSSNEEEDPVKKYHLTFVDNLPEAENIQSTSAYIPVTNEGDFYLYYSTSENMDATTKFVHALTLTTKADQYQYGFNVVGLDPGTTYYYTMECVVGGRRVASKQIKSFTTQQVGIEFMEPLSVSRGNWSELVPRVRTINIGDNDTVWDLFVSFYAWPESHPDNVSISAVTRFVGDGVWIDDSPLAEGYCYQAAVVNSQGTVFAKTPAMLWKDGALVEVK